MKRKNSCCSCLSLWLTTHAKLSNAPSNGLKNRITKENKEPWDKVQRAKISYDQILGKAKVLGVKGPLDEGKQKAKFLDFTFLTWFQAPYPKKKKEN